MVPVMMRRTASVWALLAVAALLCGAARAQTSPPPLPPWVRLRTDADTPQRAALLNWNRMLVANANRTNATFDLAW